MLDIAIKRLISIFEILEINLCYIKTKHLLITYSLDTLLLSLSVSLIFAFLSMLLGLQACLQHQTRELEWYR